MPVPSVAIIGRPNVGKSSLFNALLEDDRAIVAETPGTTRDYLEAWIDVDGVPVRLVDTAGQRATGDGVEADGVRRARDWEEAADFCVRVVDLSPGAGGRGPDGPPAAERARPRAVIIVGNKVDLRDGAVDADAEGCEILVSARTGEGVAELRRVLGRSLVNGSAAADTEPVPGERHEEAIRRAVRSLELAMQSWRDGVTEELLAGDVRDAASALGEITGRTVGPEVLDRIFSRFCIGK